MKIDDLKIKKSLADFLPSNDAQILVYDALPSTNDHLFALLKTKHKPLPQTVIIAEQQTAGKGQQGRVWISPPGNIYFSMYWQFQCGLHELHGLSIVVGLAVARVLKANNLSDVQLHWPNDIYWGDAKLGGILIETKQNAEYVDVILGLGLNVQNMQHLQHAIDQKFVSLEDALHSTVDREILIAQIIAQLILILQQFQIKTFNGFIDELQSYGINI